MNKVDNADKCIMMRIFDIGTTSCPFGYFSLFSIFTSLIDRNCRRRKTGWRRSVNLTVDLGQELTSTCSPPQSYYR